MRGIPGRISRQRVGRRWALARLTAVGAVATVLPWWLALTFGRGHYVLVAALTVGLALIGIYWFPMLTNSTVRGAFILASTSLLLLSGRIAIGDQLWWESSVALVLLILVSWLSSKKIAWRRRSPPNMSTDRRDSQIDTRDEAL